MMPTRAFLTRFGPAGIDTPMVTARAQRCDLPGPINDQLRPIENFVSSPAGDEAGS